MSIRIEILENNTVELFNDEQEPPIVRQPTWPNGEAWADAAEARAWAEMCIEAIENEGALLPPSARGAERKAMPTLEEQQALAEAFRNGELNPTE